MPQSNPPKRQAAETGWDATAAAEAMRVGPASVVDQIRQLGPARLTRKGWVSVPEPPKPRPKVKGWWELSGHSEADAAYFQKLLEREGEKARADGAARRAIARFRQRVLHPRRTLGDAYDDMAVYGPVRALHTLGAIGFDRLWDYGRDVYAKIYPGQPGPDPDAPPASYAVEDFLRRPDHIVLGGIDGVIGKFAGGDVMHGAAVGEDALRRTAVRAVNSLPGVEIQADDDPLHRYLVRSQKALEDIGFRIAPWDDLSTRGGQVAGETGAMFAASALHPAAASLVFGLTGMSDTAELAERNGYYGTLQGDLAILETGATQALIAKRMFGAPTLSSRPGVAGVAVEQGAWGALAGVARNVTEAPIDAGRDLFAGVPEQAALQAGLGAAVHGAVRWGRAGPDREMVALATSLAKSHLDFIEAVNSLGGRVQSRRFMPERIQDLIEQQAPGARIYITAAETAVGPSGEVVGPPPVMATSLAHYVTDIGQTPLHAELAPYLKLDPDGLSLAEAQAAERAVADEVLSAKSALPDDPLYPALAATPQERVFEEVYELLRNINRQPNDALREARHMAEMFEGAARARNAKINSSASLPESRLASSESYFPEVDALAEYRQATATKNELPLLLPEKTHQTDELRSKPPRKRKVRPIYLGKTPGFDSATGRAVVERMRDEGRIEGQGLLTVGNRNGLRIRHDDGTWHLIDDTYDMSHVVDAVRWWNIYGRFTGSRSEIVREFMLDPRNYELEPRSSNRARGAKLKERYQSPTRHRPPRGSIP